MSSEGLEEKRVQPGDAREGGTTAHIVSYTSQVPSGSFLAEAVASITGSLALRAAKKEHEARFVGQWAAPFLLLGLYNKLNKQHGSDASSRQTTG